VGHFIGSPGMNFLSARWRDGWIELAGRRYAPPADEAIAQRLQAAGTFKIGVRPEYLRLARADDEQAVPVVIERAQDIGTYWIAAARLQDNGPDASADGLDNAPLLRARLGDEAAALRPGETAWFSVFHRHTCYYVDEELVR